MMQQQITLDLECIQGATFGYAMTYTNPDGSAINLTGWRAAMEVRKVPTAATSLASLTTENGRITLGGASGSIDLEIEDTITASFEPGLYRYDLMLFGPTTTIRLLKGVLSVDASCTKARRP